MANRVSGYPEQWIRVTGNSDDKIYASGEYWGELGGNEEVLVSHMQQIYLEVQQLTLQEALRY